MLVGGGAALRLGSIPIVIAATGFLAWLDTRASGEDVLLANLGTSTARILATVASVTLTLELLAFALLPAK